MAEEAEDTLTGEHAEETLTGEPAARELVRDASGRVVAEIVPDRSRYLVVQKARATFPPSNRRTVIGSFESMAEAREAAESLGRG